MRTQGENGHLQVRDRSLRKKPTLADVLFLDFQQNCETIHFYCLSPHSPTSLHDSQRKLTHHFSLFLIQPPWPLSFICCWGFGPDSECSHTRIGVKPVRCLPPFASVLGQVPGGPAGSTGFRKESTSDEQMRNFLQQLQALLGRANRDVTFWIIFILLSAGEENSLWLQVKNIIQQVRNFLFSVLENGLGPRFVSFPAPSEVIHP